MKILIVETVDSNLRSQIRRFSCENTDNVLDAWDKLSALAKGSASYMRRKGMEFRTVSSNISSCSKEQIEIFKKDHEHYQYYNFPQHYIEIESCINYETVLHALGDGWELIAPPNQVASDSISYRENQQRYEWWLKKD